MTKFNTFCLFIISLMAVLLIACQGAEVKKPIETSLYRSPYRPIKSLEPGTILHIPTGVTLSENELISYLSGSLIIFVGESHKSVNHHKIQLKILKELNEEYPDSMSVGMEMFKKSSQSDIDKWLASDLSDKEFFKVWMSNWGVDYEYYREILEYIKDNEIPLIALNAPKESIKAAVHENIEKDKDRDEFDELLAVIELPVIDETDQYHRAMTKAIFNDPSHIHNNFDAFYKIQLLWEETMAETIAKYLMSTEGFDKRMIVFSGGGHINYGFGIPKRLFRRLTLPYTTILPVSTDILKSEKAARAAVKKGAKFMEVEIPNVPLHLADFVWATTFETISTEPPKLGVYLVQDNDQVAITIISKDSPAEEYGLKEGDVIKGLNDEPITDILDIKYFLKSKKYGDRVVVTVKRGASIVEVKMMLKPLLKKD